MIDYKEELDRLAKLIIDMLINHPEIDTFETELICRRLVKLGYIDLDKEQDTYYLEKDDNNVYYLKNEEEK